MKDKEKKDLLSYLFVLSVSLFISSFFITLYRFFFFLKKCVEVHYYIVLGLIKNGTYICLFSS